MIIYKNLILKISSLRFAISLIIFIAIASGIGTFIPQGSNKIFYIDNFDSAPIFGFLDGEIVLKLQLDHIYTSFWYLFALILLCISLAACSFRRQIPSLKASLKWVEYKSEKKFSKLQLTSSHPIRFKGLTIYQADWAISNVVLEIDNILYQLQLKEIPEIGNQVWGV